MSFLHAALTKERVRVAQLTTLYGQFGHSDSFIQQLIAEIELDGEETLPNASWLLRRYLTDHPDIELKLLQTAVEVMMNSRQWVPRIHLCQIFSSIDCPESLREPISGFLIRSGEDDNAFIRAWAFTALHHLKKNASPGDRAAINRILKRARSDPAKCVQARLRKIQSSVR